MFDFASIFRRTPLTGIELLDGEWRIAQVVRSAGAWTVINRFTVKFGPLPQEAPARVAAMAEALKAALRQRKLRLSEARLCISKNQATARYRRLPPTQNEEELAQMARFEALRHIPFNAERHLIDYYVMAREELAGSDVMTVAVDAPVIEEALAVCGQAGIDAALADVSSVVLFRLYLARAPSPLASGPLASGPLASGPLASGPLASGAAASASTALLHIGKSSADVVLIHKNIALFARNAAIGVQGLVDAMGFDAPSDLRRLDAEEAMRTAPSYGVAGPAELIGPAITAKPAAPVVEPKAGGTKTEEPKAGVRASGAPSEDEEVLDLDLAFEGPGNESAAAAAPPSFASLPHAPGFEVEPDHSLRPAPSAAEPATQSQRALRSWLQRLAQELRRSYEFAYREFGCPPIGEILISGVGSALGRLDGFLSRDLGVRVRPLLAGVAPPIKESAPGAPGAEALDADALDADALSIGVALDDPEGRERGVNLMPETFLRQRRRRSQTAAMLTTATLAVCAIVLLFIWFNQRSANRNAQRILYQRFISDYAPRVAEIEKKEFEIGIFEEFRNPKKSALNILDFICGLDLVKKNVKLTAFTFKQGDTLTLDGHAMNLAALHDFEKQLRDSGFFTDVEIIRHAPFRLPRREQQEVLDFEIRCVPLSAQAKGKGLRPRAPAAETAAISPEGEGGAP